MPDSMIDVETSTSASPRRKPEHPLLELLLVHLPVRDREAQLRAQRAQPLGGLVDVLDAVVEEERLAAARVLALERLLDELLVVLADVGLDRAAALRRRLDHARCRAGRRGSSAACAGSASRSSRSRRP